MAIQIATNQLADDSVDATKLKDDATTDANRAVTSDHVRDSAIVSAKIATAAVTAGKIATGGVSAAGQFAAGVVDTAAIAANAVTNAKLATAVQNVLLDAVRGSSFSVISRTLTTGTSQPASLADSLFTGKSSGGAVNGSGTAGIVASSFASSAAETGTAAAQGGLGSAAASAQPYNTTDFPGQNRIICGLQKADGDDPVLGDMLSTATGADINAKVYAYLSFRSDLGADLKWRLWYYYRRNSDGFETPFTPDTSLTNVTLKSPEVFLLKDLPVAHGVGQATVGSQAAAAVGAGSIRATELATDSVTTVKIQALAVTTAKIAALAVTTAEIAALAVTTAKIAAGAVTTTELGAAAVTTAKLATDSVDATILKDDAATDSNRAVTTDHIRDLAITTAKLGAGAVTTAKIGAGAVTTAELGALAVTTAKIAAGAVTTAELGANAVTEAKIAALTITNASISASAAIAESKLVDLGKESAADLITNIRRRDEELNWDAIDAEGFVIGTGDEAKIEQAGTPGMSVRIIAANASWIVYGANSIRQTGAGIEQTVSINTADATNPRIDVISLNASGALVATAGTPAASPAEPSLPTNNIKLATVYVAANDTAINNADISDQRRRAGRTPNQETRTSSTATTFVLARRLAGSRAKRVYVYRNGLRIKYVASPTLLDEYKVTNEAGSATAENGSRITFGAAPASTDEHVVDYIY